jgi:hypothetical protein
MAIMENLGPYSLLFGTWALHIPVALVTFASLRSWSFKDALASYRAEPASLSRTLYTTFALLSGTVLLFAPVTFLQKILHGDKIGVYARSCGSILVELGIFNMVHGATYHTLMFQARVGIVALSGIALMWHWGLFGMPVVNVPKSATGLAAALLVAGPALISLPAAFAEQNLLKSGGLPAFGHIPHHYRDAKKTPVAHPVGSDR